MSQRFYVNCPLQPGPVRLEGAEARHLAVVCRLRPGDAVCLFNGDGREYPATVTAVERRSIALEIERVEAVNRELPTFIEMAVPLPKGDRAQFLVEKLTELGVARLVPLRTARSVVHPGETKQEKLRRWVIEASKQCGRNVLMEVAPLADWQSYSIGANLPTTRWLAHPVGAAPTPATPPQPFSESRLAVAVGPEGGFTDEEIVGAVSSGWQTVNLGPRTLRVETAAIALAASIVVRAPHLYK
jgi:16S rRNA (uracil1498-N3)-methyltransferase